MVNIKLNDLVKILARYHKRSPDEKVEVEVHYGADITFERFNQGVSSVISKSPQIMYTVHRGKREKEDKTRIFIQKEYDTSELWDASHKIRQDDRYKPEVDALYFLSKHTQFLPRCYAKNLNGKLLLLEDFLGERDLGTDFKVLTDTEEIILKNIFLNKPMETKSLEKHTKDKISADELKWNISQLKKRDLIRQGDREEKFCYFTTDLFDSRFKINEKLKEKEEYIPKRREIFKKGITSILDVQNKAIENITSEQLIQLNTPKFNRESYTERFMRRLDSIVEYAAKEGGFENEVKNYSKDKEKIKELYKKEFGRFLEYESKNIIQGDCHIWNMIHKKDEDKICLVDLFHMSVGSWLSDIVDYLMSAKLFAGISESEYQGMLMDAYVKRKDLQCTGENEAIYVSLKKVLDIDRGVYYAGAGSGYIVGGIPKRWQGKPFLQLNKNEKDVYRTNRAKYISYIKNSLELMEDKECSPKFKKLLNKYLI